MVSRQNAMKVGTFWRETQLIYTHLLGQYIENFGSYCGLVRRGPPVDDTHRFDAEFILFLFILIYILIIITTALLFF